MGSRRGQGSFAPLIDKATFWQAQALLRERKHKAASHKRLHPDFPLRQFVRCGTCEKGLTGSWSKGKGKRYGYYHCTGCGLLVRRGGLHEQWQEVLQTLRPQPEYLKLFKAVVLDVWNEQKRSARDQAKNCRRRLADMERQLERLDDLVIRGTLDDDSYRSRRDGLREQKALLAMEANDAELETLDVEAVVSYAEFVALNVDRLWVEAQPAQRGQLQRVVFPEGTTYRDGRFGNAVTGLFFSDLEDESAADGRMATLEGFEPSIFTLKG